jgi:hypothetical protein
MNTYDVLIIGGGAAGFFTAINTAEKLPNAKIAILERGKEVLTKVKISGGGRCNVTHAEFIPKELSKNYPRGEKEMLGPFHSFMTGDTMAWFEERGVELKIEEDGRIFPITNDSQTIINCFLDKVEQLGVEIKLKESATDISFTQDFWNVKTTNNTYTTKHLVVATGSNPKMWKTLSNLDFTVETAVPSLFTFNIKDKRINGLMGLATEASVKVLNTANLESSGPLLITHWGMSGPAILKLSAWGARVLNDKNYQFKISVNWRVHYTTEETLQDLNNLKQENSKKSPYTHAQFDLPKRLWHKILQVSTITETQNWADLKKQQLQTLANELTNGIYQVNGKSTFKEEFVTAGGIDLKDINFKTFESKLHNNLYFAGEVLNIDAITGGFNFQNAWTGGYIISEYIAKQL